MHLLCLLQINLQTIFIHVTALTILLKTDLVCLEIRRKINRNKNAPVGFPRVLIFLGYALICL